jgi:predicted permease
MSNPFSLRRLGRRLRALVSPAAVERELDAELRFHVEMEAEYNERLGLTPDQARDKALRELGDLAQWRRQAGVPRRGRLADAAGRDLRVASRALRRSPAFTAVAVLTLALAIGVTTAVFSAVDGVLLRALPYPQPDRLVRLYERTDRGDRVAFTDPNLRDVRAQTRTLVAVAHYSVFDVTVLGADEPARARAAAVSREFFEVLGVRAAHGRTFAPEEGRDVGGARGVVVSHAFWQRALGGDPRFQERALRVGSDAFPVVGVLPADVGYPARVELWYTEPEGAPSRTAHNWSAIARLAEGASVHDAQAEIDGLLRRLKATHGAEMSAEGALVAGLHAELGRGARTSLLALLGAVACVLLVACVNLAGATLARNETRRREFGVRAALGAGRGRLVRQLLAENLVLAGTGGVLGVALAFGLTRALAMLAPAALPAFATLQVDGRVLAFAAAVTLLTALAVGLAPAWQATRGVEGSVARAGRGAVDGGLLPGRRALIAAEVALALMLLAGAGLLVRSLDALLNEELGFRPARVLAANVALPGALYDDTARVSGFFARLGPELRALPGVESVGLINAVPFGGEGGNSGFMVDGGTESVGDADYRVVDAGYFPTVGIPLVAGRAFADADGPGAPHALLINQTAARRYWPGTNPLGHRVRFPGMDSHADQWLTIVGVVGDARDDGLDAPPRPAMYVHVLQRPERLRQASTMVLRAGTPPELLTAAVRARVRALDPNVPVQLAPLQTFVARSVAGRRFAAGLLSGFALLAVGLAALGIYGVLAFAVAQRQREIGVRMALGAGRGDVRRMVVRDGMRAVLPGVVLGLAGALAVSRLLRGMLYGVSASDPLTFLSVAAVLTVVALLASWLPARRATRVDPMIAIRAE